MAFKQMFSFNQILFICILLMFTGSLQCEGYKVLQMEGIDPTFKHLFVRRSQINGILGESSHASKAIMKEVAHSINGKVSKAPKGKGFTIPSRGMMSKSHFNEVNHNSSPRSILRQSTISPSRSKFSNRVSFHNDKQVVHPSSSSKHSISPYGGSLGHVQEHQGSKPTTSKTNRQESFKNPFGHSSSSATSRSSNKNNQISQRIRSNRDQQGTSVFQSSHTVSRSRGRSNGGNSRISSPPLSHSPPSSAHHPQSTELHEEKPVKGFSKVARDYPGLGFAVTGAGLIVGTTSIVTHNMRAKEDEVMRKKKELGVPPVDLSKERKAAEEKLQKHSSSSINNNNKPSPPSNPPPKSSKLPSTPVKGPKK